MKLKEELNNSKRELARMEFIKKEKKKLEEKLNQMNNMSEETMIMKTQLKGVIHTMIDVLEKIFFLQINPSPDTSIFYEIQTIITSRLFELNKSKSGIDLSEELDRLSHLQTKIQEYLKESLDKKLKIPLEKIEEEQEMNENSNIINKETNFPNVIQESSLNPINASNIKTIEEDCDEISFNNSIETLKNFMGSPKISKSSDERIFPIVKQCTINLDSNIIPNKNSDNKENDNKAFNFNNSISEKNSGISKVNDSSVKNENYKYCVAICNFKAQKVCFT